MRFIIHELPYEKPLLAGQLRYERNGQFTGAVESWRLSDAVDGYRFIRIDLDARLAPSGRSYLYHLTLNPAGVLEQIKYRFWGDGIEAGGTVVNQGDVWLGGRTVEQFGYEDEARGQWFLVPSTIGLSLMRRASGEQSAVTFSRQVVDPKQVMALIEIEVHIQSGLPDYIDAVGERLEVIPLHVVWPGHHRTVWVDQDGRPLRLWRDDDLTATAVRLVRYG
jgi:hypothetical protein